MIQYSLRRLWNGTFTRKKKSKRNTTNVSISNEKSVDLTMRSSGINCGEDHPLDSCLRFIDMALKDRVNFLSNKSYCF